MPGVGGGPGVTGLRQQLRRKGRGAVGAGDGLMGGVAHVEVVDACVEEELAVGPESEALVEAQGVGLGSKLRLLPAAKDYLGGGLPEAAPGPPAPRSR